MLPREVLEIFSAFFSIVVEYLVQSYIMKSILYNVSKLHLIPAFARSCRHFKRREAVSLSLADAVAGGNPMFAHRPVRKIPDGPENGGDKGQKRGQTQRKVSCLSIGGTLALRH